MGFNHSQISFLIFSCWVYDISERPFLLQDHKNVHLCWDLTLTFKCWVHQEGRGGREQRPAWFSPNSPLGSRSLHILQVAQLRAPCGLLCPAGSSRRQRTTSQWPSSTTPRSPSTTCTAPGAGSSHRTFLGPARMLPLSCSLTPNNRRCVPAGPGGWAPELVPLAT